MQCTNGHDNPDGQKFCGDCGAPIAASIDSTSPPPPPPLTPLSDPTHGSDETDESAAAAPPKRRRRKTWIIVAAVGIVIVVVIAIANGGDTTKAVKRASGDTHTSVVSNDTPIDTTPTTEPAKHEVTITGNGFTQLPPDSINNSYASYGVVVQNPSTDIATRVSLNVAFYNDAGVVVKADSPTIDVILPGQTAAYGDTVQVAGATRMEVQALVGDWETPTSTPGAFTASGVSTTARDFGGLQTNATLSSTFAKDLKEVVAVAIYRDGGGAIVGGDRTFVDFVPTGGQAAVEISSFADLPAPAATEVYGELSNLSLLGT
jgi:hypothetical protein